MVSVTRTEVEKGGAFHYFVRTACEAGQWCQRRLCSDPGTLRMCVTLCSKEDFVGVRKLRLLRWQEYHKDPKKVEKPDKRSKIREI